MMRNLFQPLIETHVTPEVKGLPGGHSCTLFSEGRKASQRHGTVCCRPESCERGSYDKVPPIVCPGLPKSQNVKKKCWTLFPFLHMKLQRGASCERRVKGRGGGLGRRSCGVQRPGVPSLPCLTIVSRQFCGFRRGAGASGWRREGDERRWWGGHTAA